MFVTIRRYNPKNGSINKASLELLRRQLQSEFLPPIQQIPGFRSFYVVGIEDRELMMVSLYDTREGAAEYGRSAADYTQRNPLVFELGQPEITEGQVLAGAELRVEPERHAEEGNGVALPIALWPDDSPGMLLSASER